MVSDLVAMCYEWLELFGSYWCIAMASRSFNLIYIPTRISRMQLHRIRERTVLHRRRLKLLISIQKDAVKCPKRQCQSEQSCPSNESASRISLSAVVASKCCKQLPATVNSSFNPKAFTKNERKRIPCVKGSNRRRSTLAHCTRVTDPLNRSSARRHTPKSVNTRFSRPVNAVSSRNVVLPSRPANSTSGHAPKSVNTGSSAGKQEIRK